MKSREKLLGRLYRRITGTPIAGTAVYECPNCGCTYDSDRRSCEECWNERLVRIK